MEDPIVSVHTARRQLLTESRESIEQATARVWASRAIAAYQIYIDSGKHQLQWLIDCVDYQHEAIEHAAMVSADDGAFLLSIRQWMEQYIPFRG